MARLFGVRLVVILGFALAVVLVQIIAVSRLGSYSQEFLKEEEHKLHVLSRKTTTTFEHVSIIQVTSEGEIYSPNNLPIYARRKSLTS